MAASHTDPSMLSPSPISTYVRWSEPVRRASSAIPRPAASPCPSDPVATSTNGRRGVGCPSRSESIRRSLRSSARSKAPASAHAAYSSGARVPLREHEPIAVRVPRVPRIESHLGEEQRGDDVGGGHAGRGVAACRRGRRPDRVDAKTRRDVVERTDQGRAVDSHSKPPLGAVYHSAPRPPEAGSAAARSCYIHLERIPPLSPDHARRDHRGRAGARRSGPLPARGPRPECPRRRASASTRTSTSCARRSATRSTARCSTRSIPILRKIDRYVENVDTPQGGHETPPRDLRVEPQEPHRLPRRAARPRRQRGAAAADRGGHQPVRRAARPAPPPRHGRHPDPAQHEGSRRT